MANPSIALSNITDNIIEIDGKEKVFSSINNTSSSEAPAVRNTENIDEEQANIFLVIPPDGGWGWVVVAGAFFSFLISDGIIFAFGIFLKDMSDSFECSKSKSALVGAIMTGCYCLTGTIVKSILSKPYIQYFVGPFASAIVNRFGYRKVAVFGSLIASLSCALTSISSSLYVTYVTYGVIGGMGFGLIYIPAMIAVGFYFEKWRALATGIALCGAGVGGMTMPPILNIFLDKFGWRSTFKLMAILSSICAVFALLYKPIKPTRLITANVLPEKESELEHVIATDNNKRFFTRFHNISHPTIAEIHSKSRATIIEVQASSVPEVDENKPLSMVTILMPHILSENTSSEFIMEEIISGTSTSKSSFKSGKLNKLNSIYSTKITDSKLSTIYEESKSQGCCSKLFQGRFCSKPNMSMQSPKKWFRKTVKNNDMNIVRPLYRDDIFYSASLTLLPEYRKSLQMSESKTATTSTTGKSKPHLEYGMLVTRAITQKEIDETKTCTSCPEAMKRILATMLDFSLLKSPSFLLLAFNALFTSLGYFTPYMFIKDRAVQHGIAENQAVWLLSCIGVTNTLGRIACGIITSFPKKRALKLSYLSLLMGGLTTTISGLSYNAWIQFGYAGLYGLSIACTSVLRTIIIVDLLGLEKLTNAVGILLLFQGAASLAGTSISSFLRDLTGDYKTSFYFAGISMGVGSLFLIPVKKLSTWEKEKLQHNRKN